jgi:calcium/calmodulin-dependent protein kinase I
MMDAEGQEPVWSNVSEDAQDFVRRLLVVEPSDRMTVDEALAHAWIVTSTDTLAGRSLAASLARFKKLKLTGLWRGAFKGIIATRGFSTVTKTAASE